MIKTREVNKGNYLNYLKKAEEFYDTMKTEFNRKITILACCVQSTA